MEENELRAVLAENIKKYRNKRGWNQQLLAEKIGISANYLSAVETEKGWVTPLTLVKLAKALEIEVFQLFFPINPQNSIQDDLENDKIKRFVKDLTIALNVSTTEALKNTVAKVSKEYLC
jgi:transcriptional regulator with XRE-family HTH domain